MDSEYFLNPELYSILYYNVLLFVVFFTFIYIISEWRIDGGVKKVNLLSVGLFTTATLYIGLRPIDGVFIDMMTYNRQFLGFVDGAEVGDTDVLWGYYVQFCSQIMSANLFFLTTAFLYIFPLYKAASNLFKKDSFILLLALIVSFSFWAYGTNGLRNGVAASIFTLGLSYKNRFVAYSFLIASYFIHGSMLIPLTAYTLTVFYKNPKYYFIGWLAAIPLSLVLGSFWENFFMAFGFDDRTSYFEGVTDTDRFSSTGFRWDFLLYSASAVFTGYYFVIKRGFKDAIYNRLLNTFLTANAFWVLIIRANYSNRFAYLSWFMMALIIFYPFLKEYFFKNQNLRLGIILLLYFGFTYFMSFKMFL